MVKDVILSGRLGQEVFYLHSTLLRIMAETILPKWPKAELVVTSIHRTPAENTAAGAKSEIHVVGPPYRALDIRIRNLADTLEESQHACETFCTEVNNEWVYDPARPKMVVAYGQVHGSGPHAHIQCCSATTRR